MLTFVKTDRMRTEYAALPPSVTSLGRVVGQALVGVGRLHYPARAPGAHRCMHASDEIE